jgi:hypothetical protein
MGATGFKDWLDAMEALTRVDCCARIHVLQLWRRWAETPPALQHALVREAVQTILAELAGVRDQVSAVEVALQAVFETVLELETSPPRVDFRELLRVTPN